MDFSFEYNINGEILIPLEDTFNSCIANSDNINSSVNLSQYLTYNYTQFRSVLYQNEVMRTIIGFRFTKIKGEEDEPETKIENFINDILIQIEFSVDFDKVNNPNDNNANIEKGSIVKSYEKIIAEPKKLFARVSETILNRHIDEDNKIALIEVVKPIQVPNSHLNNPILLKVDLVKKTNISFLSQIPITNINTFKTTEEYILVKTLFKEIKIIKPLLITQLKQLDCMPDISLFQIKLENVSSSVNMMDSSLKSSQLIFNKNARDDIKQIFSGIDITIKEIQISKDETCIDTKMVLNLNKKEQYIQRKTIPLRFDSLYFVICNKEHFPIIIHPGEDYNIMIKLLKESVFNDQLLFTPQVTNDSDTKRKRSIKNSFNEAFKKKSKISKCNPISNETMMIHTNTLSRINTLALTSTLTAGGKGNGSSSKSTTKSKNSKRNSLTSEGLNEEIVKFVMSTPLFLVLDTKNGYYDNMFMSILMKWKNEYRNNLQVKIDIESKHPLSLFNYFSVKFYFRNSSHNQMNLLLRFSESFDQMQVNKEDINKEFFAKCNDVVGSEGIISEIKEIDIGIILSKEEKELMFRFIPLKTGYHFLPSIDVIDSNDTKHTLKYFLYHTNKIYVEESEDDTNDN